jgi:hypothetical protein
VNNENQMPGDAEAPYLPQLVALQLGDEWDLNSAEVRDRAVNWFNSERDKWPHTMLYMNNWGGQINDAALADFIARARPDMLSFDTYPFQADSATHAPNSPAFGSPTNWYAELRRYRVYAQNAGVPLAIYRQTFHSIESGREYRNPSPSEMNLNTFGALAFGATVLIDFTYNTGASNVAPSGALQPGYRLQSNINRRARNLGKTLVHLTGLGNPRNGKLDGGVATTDILFLRGRTGDPALPFTPLPPGFHPHASNPNAAFSEWIADRNDPYLRGWVVEDASPRPDTGHSQTDGSGDVIIAWMKPLDAGQDDPQDAVDQLYFMVVNGHTGPRGTAADFRQRVQLNFTGEIGPQIQRLDSDTGKVELVELEPIPRSDGRRRLVIELDGGTGELFKFNTGDVFLGTSAGRGEQDGGEEIRAN